MEPITVVENQAILYPGDCRDTMERLPPGSVPLILTDPPYEMLESGKRGIMGMEWDATGVAHDPATWRRAFEVMIPGGWLLAFAAPATYHRLASALEGGGFEVFDMIHWVYATGALKAHDPTIDIDRWAGVEREVVGRRVKSRNSHSTNSGMGERSVPTGFDVTCATSEAAKPWQGWRTRLKPAHEPICIARRPLEGSVAQSLLTHGTGAVNLAAMATPEHFGRYPSTHWLTHHPGCDGRCHPDCPVAARGLEVLEREVLGANCPTAWEPGDYDPDIYCPKASADERNAGLAHLPPRTYDPHHGQSKSVMQERTGAMRHNHHPTVKPVQLMRKLIRLFSAPGVTVLDPFNGSGTTGCAAILEGRGYIGCELDPDYLRLSAARLLHTAHRMGAPIPAPPGEQPTLF